MPRRGAGAGPPGPTRHAVCGQAHSIAKPRRGLVAVDCHCGRMTCILHGRPDDRPSAARAARGARSARRSGAVGRHDLAAGRRLRQPRPDANGVDADGAFAIWNVAWVAHTLTSRSAPPLRREHLPSARWTLAYSEANSSSGVVGDSGLAAHQQSLRDAQLRRCCLRSHVGDSARGCSPGA